ncbi:diaminohydroxyphosphoribosylaminopyrimidine deaminase /5-amino-6-(5-phosphoribosylamino)uracil reductase [Clostridium sp. CAG:411]|jgi:diaminohydroxyphosphoribosylaminopyrimidine deaminase/5-amino-6-(5-phosphoribosylamino)uracil reductase|nr:bifunctional diaminohydroxyphosphoribosylaminopyrimidine deaminase/5-amino-6-(5-phosphoribosylamino)uracil reductase RibD [Lachnospiraceae bacterium]CDE46438.1 diaminohydroxyphosphoribosylaminopyrimidine deaminase /5-amino-6-(5-phosphoribosylamino)uracil reductase [Clostridium sp. CAG:411]
MERKYMERAIELAKRARGFTSPNPMVGAVIVKDGRVIGEGYHERCGELHAERNALASLTESAEGATIYVTLEPCCHYGKTPPCTEAIIEHKLAKVVIGSRDPNPLVSGKGAAILRKAGIEVVEDFMREECDAINPIFFHYITTKRPYVAMKYAMTMDGKIATRTGASRWITGEAARNHVQTLRHAYKGIMVGIGTVLADNPMLNCRMQGGIDPVRIVCDTHLRIPMDCQIVQTADTIETILATSTNEKEKIDQLIKKGVQILQIPEKDGCIDLNLLMQTLGEKGIDSILLEGGGRLNDSFLREKLIQKAYVYLAPKIFGGEDAKTPVEGIGVSLPEQSANFKLQQIQQIEEDILLEYIAK